MQDLQIEFGGFYGSIHENLVDSMVSDYYGDDNGDISDEIIDKIENRPIFVEYSKQWLDCFEEWLNDEFELDINFHFDELISPKYYNYSTDTILAKISNINKAKLKKCFINDRDFLAWLGDRTKNKDGYISFYTFNDAMQDKDGILSTYIVNFLANEFYGDIFIDYYDRNNLSELIFNI